MAAPPTAREWVSDREAETIICDKTGCEYWEAHRSLEEALAEGVIRSQKQATDEDGPIELSGEYWADKDGVMSDRNTRSFRRYEVHREDLLRWLGSKPVRKRGRKKGPKLDDRKAVAEARKLRRQGLSKRQAALQARHLADPRGQGESANFWRVYRALDKV